MSTKLINNYLKYLDESYRSDAWKAPEGNYRSFESFWKRIGKSMIAGVLGGIPGIITNNDFLTSSGSTVGTLIYALFRESDDICNKQCAGQKDLFYQCKRSCNLTYAKKLEIEINNAILQTRKLPSGEERNKLLKTLLKDKKWIENKIRLFK